MMIRFILFVALLGAGSLFAECRTVLPDEFSKLLNHDVKKIVFFSSWCKSCGEHLTQDFAKEAVFVAAFDQKEAAEKVMQRFFPEGTKAPICIYDGDEHLVKQYGVKYLPFVAKL